MSQIGDLVSKAGIYANPEVITEKKEDGTVVSDTLFLQCSHALVINGLGFSSFEFLDSQVPGRAG